MFNLEQNKVRKKNCFKKKMIRTKKIMQHGILTPRNLLFVALMFLKDCDNSQLDGKLRFTVGLSVKCNFVNENEGLSLAGPSCAVHDRAS